MSRLKAILLALTCVLSGAAVLPAQSPFTLILSTAAPDKSEWQDALAQLGDSLKRGTGNRVALRIHPGGTLGSEKAVVDRMMAGSLHAALLTASGLVHIDDAFNVFGLPFFFESDAEMHHVQEKLTPLIAAKLEARRFRLLGWAEGGWVQLFSKRPLKTLAEVKKVKLYTSEGNDKMVQWYKSNGFNPVALPDSAIMTQLKTLNGVEAVPMPAYPAQLLRLYSDAPHMMQIEVAQLVGATVITTEAWNRISEPDRKVLTSAVLAMQKRLETSIPRLDNQSIAEMQKEGRDLKVTKLDPRAAAEFRAEAEKLSATVSGSIVPKDVFEAALRERAAYRASRSGTK